MTYQSYSIDPQAAKNATQGGRIEQTGKYIANVLRAEFITSAAPKCTQGIEFEIETANKATCSFTLWTRKKDGTNLMGYDKLCALMACAGVRTLTPTNQKIEKYDYDSKARKTVDCVVAAELMGKSLGWLLERENYLNNNQEQRTRMQLYANFQADSELVASEILDRKTEPKELENLVIRLMNKPEKAAKQSGSSPQVNQSQVSNDLDDDLPF